MEQNLNLTSLGYGIKTLEDIRKMAPAAFAESYDPKRSKIYSFVSTVELLNAFEKAGWVPTHAKQNGSSNFSRHIIRLNNPSLKWLDVKGDKIKPQAILDNSHDGGSSAQFHMGLFRMICSNGLVIGIPGLTTNVKFRHMGVNVEEIKKLMAEVAEEYTKVSSHIKDWQDVVMNQDQKEEFVINALALREPDIFMNADRTLNTQKILKANNPIEILKPIRGEDEANNLWSVFNIVQEKMIKGGYTRISEKGRRCPVHGIQNATRNITYNRKLWELGENYRNLVDVSNIKTYVTAKGVETQVKVLQELEEGKVQVKDVNANRTFIVGAERLS